MSTNYLVVFRKLNGDFQVDSWIADTGFDAIKKAVKCYDIRNGSVVIAIDSDTKVFACAKQYKKQVYVLTDVD